MGVAYNSRIITDGLVLALDAGNTKSYSGSGTTWTDLSGRGNTGTLTNGPTYSSSNGGSIVFDGVDDYINLQSGPYFPSTGESWAVDCWFFYVSGSHIPIYTQLQSLTSNSDRLQVAINSISSGSGTWSSYAESSSGLELWNINTSSSISSNTWTHASFIRDGQNFYIYKNAVLIVSGTSTNNLENTNRQSYIGRNRIGNVSQFFNGRISNLRIYKNKALTASEISQNFNALRGRFGI